MLLVSLATLSLDILIVMVSEYVVSSLFGILPQYYLHAIAVLLISSLPVCLGSIVLSSLTSETLRKKSEALLKDTQKINKELEALENKRKAAQKDLEDLQNKRKEFEKFFKRSESGKNGQ